MSDNRVELVRRSWGEVLAWCQEHAPATAADMQGPADAAALTDAQAQTGLVWPEQLLGWLGVSDGVAGSYPGIIPVGFMPLGVGQIVEKWRMLTDISVDVWPADDLAQWEGEPAGTKSFGFLRSWLPVASNFGNARLFVDRRPGPRSGCVGQYEDDLGFIGPPTWDDVAQMVEVVASAFREERWVDGQGYALVPTVTEGRLGWEDDDEWETVSWDPTPGDVWPSSDDLPTKVMLLYAQGHSDAKIATRLGIPLERVTELRDEFRRTH